MSFTILQIRKSSWVLTFVCQTLVFVPVLGPRDPKACRTPGQVFLNLLCASESPGGFQTQAAASQLKLLIQ